MDLDLEKILEACIVLGIDFLTLSVCYGLYKDKSQCLKALKNAHQLDLNSELTKTVQKCGGVISYAVIAGKVSAMASPLVSEHSPLQGVIQERITNEYKVKWIPSLHIWSSIDKNVSRQMAAVPFGICAKPGLFHKKILVEITNPLSTEELLLTEVFNEYIKHDQTLTGAIKDFILSEHTVGVRKIENMLLEDSPLTAIGKIVLEDDKLKMTSPDDGLPYYLTHLSFDSLCKKIGDLASFYKWLSIVMCCISAFVVAYYFRKAFVELRRQLEHRRDLKKCLDAIKVKRDAAAENDGSGERDRDPPKCIVCLESSVEVIILECGHACLCLRCSRSIHSLCPVCRGRIHRIVPVFLP